MTALPDSIIQNGLFCCWKYEERNERKTKVPYQPQTGLGAKSNNPSSFVPYKTAVQASGYDGIGIGIFNGICAIDLDNCVSDSGYYTQTAAEIVALMHSYESLATAAKKYVIQEKKERHLQKLLDAANQMISKLERKIAELMSELAKYKSVRGKLHINELEQENAKLRDKLRSYETVIDRHDLWHLFGRKQTKTATREESR